MSDLLFNFTEWLRTTFLVDFSLWISDTSLSMWLVTHFWAIPIMQVVHILSIAAAFGAILMINLRIFGMAGMDRTFAETERRYTRWIWWALLTLVISGLGMITAEPIRELINPIFWIKMILVIVAILTSLWFHRGVMTKLSTGGAITSGTKGGAVFIIILWCVIMLCGRWIAYAPV
ncbi:hypothetical protein GRI89_05100 [Altererythrobacter salegens]|uniref:DUF6644 domain-containing protein n=1 Tax=Croceibacterium salegens TaxID=1737568 RepID=A0A6I4SSK4_9SPHN|nr:DUF6644 family protein [Croceibacterium salegens]MXO58914.1 hypothetical protein [Croceibacterium salegens]